MRDIDIVTFEHSLRNLTKNEIFLILQQFNYEFDEKQKKGDLVELLIKQAKEELLPEGMGNTFRERAFSIDKNFNDGFFYKIDEEYIGFDINKFDNIIKEKAQSYTGDTNINVNLSIKNDELIFVNFKRSKKDWAYDFEKCESKAYMQVIKADIEIYVKKGLVYIHSKNLTESRTIKHFLDQCFKEIDNGKKKKILGEPKFDERTAQLWFEENENDIEFKINGISLHMLDLFYQFESEESNFSNICMQRIYFKENTVYTNNDEASITDSQYGGNNLQQHGKIIQEIKAGKRILGFSLQADYCYVNEDGEDISTILPITVLYGDKNYLRLSIPQENIVNSVDEKIPKHAYDDVKELYMDKYLTNCIFNTNKLKECLVSDVSDINTELIDNSNKNKENTWSI